MKLLFLLILAFAFSCATQTLPEREVASDKHQEKSKKNKKFDFVIDNLGRR